MIEQVEGWLVVIVTAALVLSSRFSYGTLRNPIALLLTWWAFWLAFVYLGMGGVFPISRYTLWLATLAMWAFAFAALLPIRLNRHSYVEDGRRLEKTWGYVRALTVVFVVPVVAFFSIRALAILSTEGFVGYRNLTFSRAGEPSALFGSAIVEGLYTLFISPILPTLFVLGVAWSFKTQTRVWIMPAILLVMDSAMRLGRSGPYVVVVALFVAVFLHRKPQTTTSSKSMLSARLWHAGFLALTIAFVGAIGIARDGSEDVSPAEHTIQWGAVYHAAGYVILDQELHQAGGLLSTSPTYGRSFLSGVERYGVLLLRRLDTSIEPVVHTSGTYLDEYRQIATSADGGPLMGNAFATSLFSLYRDGGEVGVLLGSVGFGLLVSLYFRTWQTSRLTIDFAIVLALVLGGWLSIFQSQFDRAWYWLLFLLSLVLHSALRSRKNQYFTARSVSPTTQIAG